MAIEVAQAGLLFSGGALWQSSAGKKEWNANELKNVHSRYTNNGNSVETSSSF